MSLTVAVTLACQGNLSSSGQASAGSTGTAGSAQAGAAGAGGSAVTTPESAIAPGVVRRLTRREYNNTMRDLLSDTTRPADGFLPDDTLLGFDNIAGVQTVSPVLAEQYLLAAERLAKAALPGLVAQFPCAAMARDSACADTFVRDVGARAWRRPLAESEVQRVLGVYQLESSELGFEAGLTLALETLLMSAPFPFRIELGEPVPDQPGRLRPTSYEMATRLSYLLWGSMPDATLAAAAAQGTLTSAEQVKAHAERLLADPRARDSVAHFHEQWLLLASIDAAHAPKDSAFYPEASEALIKALRTEVELFVEDAFWKQPASLSALFTSSTSFIDGSLAGFYGVSGPTGEAFEPVALSATERPGLLTRAGLLALLAHPDGTSPTKRGKFVRTQLLCQPLPPPPPSVNAMLPDRVPGQTTRERVAAHQTDPTCAACHNLVDPIGLGFEQYDGLGRFRSEEGGVAVDASGSVDGADFVDPAFFGAAELGEMLAASQTVRDCVARQWFRYAQGRQETSADTATLTGLAEGLVRSGGSFPQLLLALTQTPQFLYREAPGAP